MLAGGSDSQPRRGGRFGRQPFVLTDEHKRSLAAAAEVRKRLGAAKAAPLNPEPKQGKLHWEHLLAEMAWMAKEFQR